MKGPPTFCDKMPRSPSKVKSRLKGTFFACKLLQAWFLLGQFFDPQTEATFSSETIVDFQRTT
jgi:hypothetical protein